MNKYCKLYGIGWLLSLIVFHVVTFVVTIHVFGSAHLTSTFWVGYALILVAFLAHLLCTYYFLKDSDREKVFLRLPILRVGSAALGVSLVVGLLFMLISALPAWLGGVIGLLVLFPYVLYALKVTVAINAVSDVGEQVRKKTVAMRSLTSDAEALIPYAVSAQAKQAAKQVYEALRYSDTVSCAEVSGIEAEIFEEFATFTNAVKSEADESAVASAKKLVLLINDRNRKCKLYK
jgi:hypothetical protein